VLYGAGRLLHRKSLSLERAFMVTRASCTSNHFLYWNYLTLAIITAETPLVQIRVGEKEMTRFLLSKLGHFVSSR